MNYVPECLRNLPPQKSKPAESKRRKVARDLADMTIIECIQRLKAARRSKPAEWERGYNSAITTLELFAAEVKSKQWAGTEGAAVVSQKFTTEATSHCTCGPGDGCTNCPGIRAALAAKEA